MKRLLILGLIFVMVFSLFAMASPASAFNGSVGDGEPPGWSQVNPGQGGADGPGTGPGNPGGP